MKYLIVTIFPLSSCWVDDSKELVIGHSLRVKVCPHGPTLHVVIGPLERPHHLTLPSACIPNNKHRVPHCQQLLQLHHLTQRQRNIFSSCVCVSQKETSDMEHKQPCTPQSSLSFELWRSLRCISSLIF